MATKRLSSRSQARSQAAPYQTLTSGPWKRVVTTLDPGDDDPSVLMDLVNGYIPDPTNGSGVYARPGAICQNPNNQLGTSGFRSCQGAWFHIDLSGKVYNFCVVGGRLYRADVGFGLTDVTPTGVSIDPNRNARVYGVSLTGTMIVSDGVHAPWIASNLDAAPITATTINVNPTAGSNWAAYGKPVIWSGALFFILSQIAGVSARASIVWSEPGDPATGYRQTNYSNYATLEQTQQGLSPLFALWPTETALYVFREGSITSLQGSLANVQSQATGDTIAMNVGSLAAAGVCGFGNTVYFPDQLGRPWSFTLGNVPQDIWKQMRAVVDVSTIGFPLVTQMMTTATIESTLNLYVLAAWSPKASALAAPVESYVFDARSGTYFGRWQFGGTPTGSSGSVWADGMWDTGFWADGMWGGPTVPSTTGISIDALGTWLDSQGRSVMVVMGSQVPGGESGYVWTLQSVSGIPDYLTAQNGNRLTTQSGQRLLSQGQQAQWMDGSQHIQVTPKFVATTNRLGWSVGSTLTIDQATVVSGSASPIEITAGTAATVSTLEGTPTPLPSQDDTYRLTCGFYRMQGRGVSIVATPTDGTDQRILHGVTVRAIPSLASNRWDP